MKQGTDQDGVSFHLAPAEDGLALANRWMELGYAGGFPERLRSRPIALDRGYIRLECKLDPGHANFVGLVHGGVTASLVDMAGGGAAMTLLKPGETLLTTDLTLRFIKAAPIDTNALFAEGRAVHHDGRKVVVDVTVNTPEGLLIAHGTVGVSIRRPRE
ncbi:PaaI family thioesterase [uncultured Brevundimonas sp.]|uniref:PaaI family thioesterase n=1 Tax=uncultured Brevundimonas sp. TaxID=213418 RepID=UPI0025FB884A|nr:PaaI family thioesterase [uncultured Brevundimonas sp.]